MNFLWNKITEWLKDMLISGIMGNLEGLFDGVNERLLKSPGRWAQLRRHGTAACSV